MILTGENWSTGRKTLHSVGGGWMNENGAMAEWYWQRKTEVFCENPCPYASVSNNLISTFTVPGLNTTLCSQLPVPNVWSIPRNGTLQRPCSISVSTLLQNNFEPFPVIILACFPYDYHTRDSYYATCKHATQSWAETILGKILVMIISNKLHFTPKLIHRQHHNITPRGT